MEVIIGKIPKVDLSSIVSTIRKMSISSIGTWYQSTSLKPHPFSKQRDFLKRAERQSRGRSAAYINEFGYYQQPNRRLPPRRPPHLDFYRRPSTRNQLLRSCPSPYAEIRDAGTLFSRSIQCRFRWHGHRTSWRGTALRCGEASLVSRTVTFTPLASHSCKVGTWLMGVPLHGTLWRWIAGR